MQFYTHEKLLQASAGAFSAFRCLLAPSFIQGEVYHNLLVSQKTLFIFSIIESTILHCNYLLYVCLSDRVRSLKAK